MASADGREFQKTELGHARRQDVVEQDQGLVPIMVMVPPRMAAMPMGMRTRDMGTFSFWRVTERTAGREENSGSGVLHDAGDDGNQARKGGHQAGRGFC